MCFVKKLFFIVLIPICFGCKEELKVDYAIITGKISNKPINKFLVIRNNAGTFQDTIEVAKNGAFIDTLIPNNSNYRIYDGENSVFLNLEPGYNLNIFYDATNFDKTVNITGIGFETNNYLLAKSLVKKSMLLKNDKLYSLEETEFLLNIKACKIAQEKLLDTTKKLNKDFIAKEKRYIDYDYVTKINIYERFHKYYTGKESFKVSKSFLKDFEELDYTSLEDFKSSKDYASLVYDYYYLEALKLAKKDSIPIKIAQIKVFGTIDNQTMRNILLFDYAKNEILLVKDVDLFYNLYMINATDEANKEIITKEYNKHLSSFSKGKRSPKFVDYENFAGGKTSLDDLKGKYVYIDLWATWCAPCMKQMPYLKQVEKKYHGRNIEFVSISLDELSHLEKWKTTIKEKKLGGVQLLADKNWESKFVKDYQIKNIPRFILIDKKGNIISANAPRPSSKDLIKLLNEYDI